MVVRMSAGEFQIVYSTVPDRLCGQVIADTLVSKKLAACVNLIPGIESTYFWEGSLQHDQGCLLMIKTQTADYMAVEAAIRELHPDELPEIIAVPLSSGSPDYLHWITRSLDKTP
ncbi:MAG: divalent-cation tolerance protein CutA [Gammaproteobacteria bacterium]